MTANGWADWPYAFQDLFKLAMKRDIPPIWTLPDLHSGRATVLNLGCGLSEIPGAIGLDWPNWDANSMPIPYGDGAVDAVFAFHFLEHVDDPIAMLREIQRVLRPGGLAFICVPYYTSQMMAHDLTHRRPFCEETWRQLFTNTAYYTKDKTGWEFNIGFNLICGVVERNLCLITQLIRR